MANYSLPTSNLNSPFYMREVNRYFKHWGKYPEYFLTELPKCDKCNHYFSPKLMSVIFTSFDKANCCKRDKNWGRVDNSCKFCSSERVFRRLAKNSLSNQGIKSKFQPEELIELEMFIHKTKSLLSNKEDEYKKFIKIKK